MSGADVLVAGGGPAGIATACTLVRRGIGTTLCEAATWPRAKMCGEFLSPDATRALEAIGVARQVARLDPPRIDAVRVTVARGGRTAADFARPLGFTGRGVSRSDLDDLLRRAAVSEGVDVRDCCRVTDVDFTDRGVVASTSRGTLAARALVVATGRLADVIRGPRRASRDWLAVKVHVRGVTIDRRTELHFVDGAYVGANQVAAGGERLVNVCALARRSAWERAGATPDGLLDCLARESPAFAARWRRAEPVDGSWVCAAGFDFAARGPTAGSHPAFFVGDAAALVAPLAGDGQAMALCGGVSLGTVLAQELRWSNDLSLGAANARWETDFRSAFGRRLLVARAVQSAMLRPRIAAALVAAASRLEPLAAWVVRGTHGPLDYAT